MVHINDVYEKIKGEEKKRRYEEEMFQKDYNKYMLSSDSDELSSGEPSSSERVSLRKNTTSRTRKNGRKEGISQEKGNSD
jgi:hypothetical protein